MSISARHAFVSAAAADVARELALAEDTMVCEATEKMTYQGLPFKTITADGEVIIAKKMFKYLSGLYERVHVCKAKGFAFVSRELADLIGKDGWHFHDHLYGFTQYGNCRVRNSRLLPKYRTWNKTVAARMLAQHRKVGIRKIQDQIDTIERKSNYLKSASVFFKVAAAIEWQVGGKPSGFTSTFTKMRESLRNLDPLRKQCLAMRRSKRLHGRRLMNRLNQLQKTGGCGRYAVKA